MTTTVETPTDLQAHLTKLNADLSDIDDRRAAIKGQIEQAQARRQTTGERADPDWFRRAKGALRHLGVERNDLCREIGETNRRLREVNGSQNRNTFYVAVRETVDDPTWERIVYRHQQLLTEEAAR